MTQEQLNDKFEECERIVRDARKIQTQLRDMEEKRSFWRDKAEVYKVEWDDFSRTVLFAAEAGAVVILERKDDSRPIDWEMWDAEQRQGPDFVERVNVISHQLRRRWEDQQQRREGAPAS